MAVPRRPAQVPVTCSVVLPEGFDGVLPNGMLRPWALTCPPEDTTVVVKAIVPLLSPIDTDPWKADGDLVVELGDRQVFSAPVRALRLAPQVAHLKIPLRSRVRVTLLNAWGRPDAPWVQEFCFVYEKLLDVV